MATFAELLPILLLDNEGDVNIRDFNKSTALHSAVGNMDSDMTLLLPCFDLCTVMRNVSNAIL